MLGSTTSTSTNRKTAGTSSRRKKTFRYYLKNDKGLRENVCKTFCLAILGYRLNDAKPVRNVISKSDCTSMTAKPDKRVSNNRKRIVNRNIIKAHIESFGPQISHYRR
ncbi:unnamed protein product [Psylliodes chrysocephalus]|uniref:Uncharacterized protein n=1 Tax=Psylliodes chrysocephalus TaxID=3402493 RepID=A0A9P0CYN5_9CUCU|nr:unnamed protein product [Psylliodes chrysocephala]